MKIKALSTLVVAGMLAAGCGSSHTVTKTVTTTHTPAASTAPASPNVYSQDVSIPFPGCSLEDAAMNCVDRTSHSRYHPDTNQAQSRRRGSLVQGADQAWQKFTASAALNARFRFIAGYFSYDGTKDWSRALVRAYQSVGITTVGIWETTATRALSGYSGGVSDARQAYVDATADGFKPRDIYFAIDFDEAPNQAPMVQRYFQGVDSVLGVSHTGAYGGYWAVSRLYTAHVVSKVWQTSAWSGGNICSCTNIYQYAYPGFYDKDEAFTADYGQEPYSNPTPPPPAASQAFNNGFNSSWAARHNYSNLKDYWAWGAQSGWRQP